MKKLINNPNEVVPETIEGIALAYPQYVRQLSGFQALVRRDAPVEGKVAVLTGGGSGHEPMFGGFVGVGMADGSVAGHVFTSPPPDPIVCTAKAIHGGAGVLFVYGNYTGDVLNFDVAAEMLKADGIRVETVRVADDVASASPDRREERRGIAGDFFVIKTAAARAEEGADLSAVSAAAQEANDNTRSMGIALSSCIIPASGKPIFDISDRDMELGMGLHGEPGIQRAPVLPANEIVQGIMDRILEDLPLPFRSEVALLVNGLGATPLAELFIVYRAAHRLLTDRGISICRAYVGNFATSLEMAGCSISMLRITSMLKRLLLAPAHCPAFVQVQG